MKIKLKELDRKNMIHKIALDRTEGEGWNALRIMKRELGEYSDTMLYQCFIQLKKFKHCQIIKAFKQLKDGAIDVRRFFQICIADALEEMSAEELEVVYKKTFYASEGAEITAKRNVVIESALPWDEVHPQIAIDKILMKACDHDHLPNIDRANTVYNRSS